MLPSIALFTLLAATPFWAIPVSDSSDNTIGPAHNLSKTTGPHKSLAERHAGVIHTVMPRNVSWGPPDADLVYSCGKNWIPVEDFQSDNGVYAGFASAVSVFCTIAGDQVEVESDGYFSQTVREAGGRAIGLNGGKDPRHNARVGRVEFEIHNKQERTHKPNFEDCTYYLMQLANPEARGMHCYGKKNQDTHGGIYHVSKNRISYRALAM